MWFQSQISSLQVRVEGNGRLLESQGGFEVGHIFVAFVGLLFLHQMPEKQQIKNVVEFARSFNIVIPAIRSLGQMLEVLPQFLPNVVQSWLQELRPAEVWFNFVNGRLS